MTLLVYVLVLCLYAFRLSNGSKGNPDPSMLKGKLARMRVMASTSAVKAKMYGLNKVMMAPGLKRTLHIREALVKSAMDIKTFNSVNVLVRKANSGPWFASKQLPLDAEQTELKHCILDGGKRAAVAQHILDKSIFSSLFGKGMGDPEFVLETRKRENEFASVKSADIEYGYQISSKFPVFSLNKFAPKPLLEKVPPLPQINIGALLNQLVKKQYIPEYPADLIQKLDQLIHIIDTTPNPTLLVTSDGSGELGSFDRREDVCLAAGGAVLLTPISRKTQSTSGDAPHHRDLRYNGETNSAATQLQNSLFVRVNHLHHLTAAPLQAELVPGLVGLVLTALLFDRYKQLHVQPPAQLRVQIQSDSYSFLSDLRHCEDLVDPRNGKNHHESNMLTATLLAQKLYAEPSLPSQHAHLNDNDVYEANLMEEMINNVELAEEASELEEVQAEAPKVPFTTHLASAPASGEDQPSRWTIQERAMWMAHQLATSRAYGAAPMPLLGPSKASTRRPHANSGASLDGGKTVRGSVEPVGLPAAHADNTSASSVSSAQRAAVLEVIAPCWRSVQKQVVDVDVREVLKWCAGIWEPTDTNVE